MRVRTIAQVFAAAIGAYALILWRRTQQLSKRVVARTAYSGRTTPAPSPRDLFSVACPERLSTESANLLPSERSSVGRYYLCKTRKEPCCPRADVAHAED